MPLFKGKGKDEASTKSYRPLTLMTSIMNIIETVLTTRLESYLTYEDSIFGYREQHSTEILLHTFKGIITRHAYTYAVFLDLSAAFDTIS
jgi:hypothetical protein